MRNILILLCGLVVVGLWLQAPSSAQCPGGVCPVPMQRLPVPQQVRYSAPISVQGSCPGGVCPAPVVMNSAPYSLQSSGYIRKYPGPLWTTSEPTAQHLLETHGIDPTGMSETEMMYAHSDAHNVGTFAPQARAVRYTTQNSLRSRPVRGVFRGLFSRLRCGR